MIIEIRAELNDYKGCGRAWAAIKDGEIVGLRYMGDFAPQHKQAPTWAKAANKAYSLSSYQLLSHCNVKNISPTHLARIKNAAIAMGHPECGPRGGHIKASYIASMAQFELAQSEKEEFAEYHDKCRQELAELGEVVSGQCSCYQFITNE